MLTPLLETTGLTKGAERRRATRLAPARGTMFADAITANGKTHRMSVADLSPFGVKLLGAVPVTVGERLQLGIHIDSATRPYRLSAIVVRNEQHTIGARFTT